MFAKKDMKRQRDRIKNLYFIFADRQRVVHVFCYNLVIKQKLHNLLGVDEKNKCTYCRVGYYEAISIMVQIQKENELGG